MAAEAAPGRSCGECNACCAYYDLTKDFGKPQGILCGNWKAGTGCGIHAVRPAICRNFYCHWLQSLELDDAWRPDRSGIIIRDTCDLVPSHWPIRQGLAFDLFGPDEAIETDAFLRAVAANVLSGVPVFLSVHKAVGPGSMVAFLNEVLWPAVISLDAERLRLDLRAILQQLRPR